MHSDRCRNYLLETEQLLISGTAVTLRVPIRRCLLSERMLGQMAETDHGREVIRKLSLTILSENRENSDQDATAAAVLPTLRAALGPDLEPIHTHECLVSRCLQSCTPGYRMMVLQFGPPETADEEIISGCLEETEVAEDVR